MEQRQQRRKGHGHFPPPTCEGSADGHEQAWASAGAVPAPRSRVPCLATMRCLPRQWGGEWSPHARALAWADFLARAWAPCLGGERALLASPAWAVCRATACCMPHASLACILAHAVRLQKIPYPLPFPAQSCWLPAMAPRSGSLAVRDGAPQDRAGSARWLRALARMLRAMVPRAGSHSARDGAARWGAGVSRWFRTLARWRLAIVPRDGFGRRRACAARWCPALARWLRASAGHFSHEGRLAVREMACQCPRADSAKNTSFCTPIFFLFLLKNSSYFSWP